MKLLAYLKDGGPESTVHGYFLVEAKRLFSVALLNFHDGSRDAYHSHAFSALSWVLKGDLLEETVEGVVTHYRPSWLPVWTPYSVTHKVYSVGETWVVTFRGPWRHTWQEYIPGPYPKWVTLGWGRKVLRMIYDGRDHLKG